MKTILLSKGQAALVDDCDYEWLSQYKWWACKCGNYVYARGHVPGQRNHTYMHRLIMNPPQGMIVDHKNMNTLDNRRANLRICNKAQNAANSRLRSTNTSGYKGAYWDKRLGKWVSYVKVNNRMKYLGSFETPELAHTAYVQAATKAFGADFVRFN